MRAVALVSTFLLSACAPEAGAPPYAYPDLDCGKAFAEVAAWIAAQPDLVAAPKSPAEPYAFLSSGDGRVSYLITDPDAPAHPAIMMQRAAGADVRTTGCAYGDKAAYDQLHAYLDGLKTWRRK